MQEDERDGVYDGYELMSLAIPTEQRIERWLNYQAGNDPLPDDEQEPDYAKVCDVRYGQWVEIVWQGEDLEGVGDEGYVFGWPSHEDRDANMAGVIHIPSPQNPGGKDEAPMEWVTLHELRCNPLVKCVRLRT